MIPTDEYVFRVVRLYLGACRMKEHDSRYVRAKGLVMYEDVKVLYDDLVVQGYIK